MTDVTLLKKIFLMIFLAYFLAKYTFDIIILEIKWLYIDVKIIRIHFMMFFGSESLILTLCTGECTIDGGVSGGVAPLPQDSSL